MDGLYAHLRHVGGDDEHLKNRKREFREVTTSPENKMGSVRYLLEITAIWSRFSENPPESNGSQVNFIN